MSTPTGYSPPPGPPLAAPGEGLVSLSLRGGWEALKRDPAVLIGFCLLKIPITALAAWILGGTLAIGAISAGEIPPFEQFRKLLWGSAIGLLDGFLSAGILYAALRILRREPVVFSTFFSAFTRFVPIILAYVIVQLVVGFGILFFLVPGIIFAIAFSQWPLLIMDRGVGGPESLGQSWHMMKGYKADYFLLWLVLITVNFVGLIPLGLGLLVTVPFTYATQAAFYERLIQLHPRDA
ncbi:MAG: DUF975 family protein [Candidatus Eisenbacteria sp.]|nr:DUF975 family protein [Candidatus Eisenbacteria bacterium]